LIITGQDDRVGEWIQERGGGFYRDGSKCVGLEKDGKLVAGVMYDYFNGSSIYAHIASLGQMNREFLWFIFHYPFVQINAKVIIGLVADDNERSIRLCNKLGFTLNTRIIDGHPSGALRIYTMRREDCKWLRTNEQTKATPGP